MNILAYISSLHKLLIKVKDLPSQWLLLLNQDNHINCASLLQSIFIADQTQAHSIENENSWLELSRL